MKQLKGIVFTTHPTPDGIVIAPAALEDFVRQINENYLPVNVEHDPRRGSIGRITEAVLVDLGDGHVGVEAIVEIYEPGDRLPPLDRGRPLQMRSYDREHLAVLYDRGLLGTEDQADIEALGRALRTVPEEEFKWSAELVVSVLVIGGTFVLATFAKEFATLLARDAYAAIKEKVSSIMQRRASEEPDRVLSLRLELVDGETTLWLDVMLTNPSAEEIDGLLDGQTLVTLQQFAEAVAALDEPPRHVALEYSASTFRILYAQRYDGVPVRLGVRISEDSEAAEDEEPGAGQD